MLDLSELDRDTLQAHLGLHGYFPAYAVIARGLNSTPMNAKVMLGADRWFAVTGGEGNFAFQSGVREYVRKHHEASWVTWSDGEIQGVVEAMVSYGELHDPG